MFFTLVRAEWTKTMRMPSTYIAFLAGGLLCGMFHFAMWVSGEKIPIYPILVRNNIDPSIFLNGYMATRGVIEVGFALLLGPMVIQIFARQVAGEDQRGTLRLVLSRPISRFALLNAKFLVSAIYCFLLMGFILAFSYGLGLAIYGPKDSITISKWSEFDGDRYRDEANKKAEEEVKKEGKDPGQSAEMLRAFSRRNRGDLLSQRLNKLVVTPREEISRLFWAWILTSWALLTIGSIAFFYSVLNRHSIAAMSMTIGTYFLVVILNVMSDSDQLLPLFKALRPYLFTNAMDYWHESLGKTIDWSYIQSKATLLGCYTAVFYAVTQIIFWRKDITS